MADVARLAGVSPQTVSRVSRNSDRVEESTRLRVRQAMRELGYRPNGAARALRSGRFRTIGVISFSLTSVGNIRTLDAITRAASTAGYAISLIPVQPSTQEAVGAAVARLDEQAVDGIVVIVEARLLDRAEVALPRDLPVVMADSDAGTRYPVVDTDQDQGARSAVRHLLDLGHRTVWHVAGPRSSYAARRRAAAWRGCLTDAGCDVPPVVRGDWSSASGYRAGRELAARPDVTAVFVANDQMALGVMLALHEQGRPVPEAVSVVGFDDTEDAALYRPPLTTVHQDFATVGRLCIEKLLAEIDGAEPGNGTTIVPTRLIVRGSTAPPGGVRAASGA